MKDLYRALPAVAKVTQAIEKIINEKNFDLKNSPLIYADQKFYTHFINEEIENMRKKIESQEVTNTQEIEQYFQLSEIIQRIEKKLSSNLKHCINASGTIIHTNLGRSPLSNQAVEAIAQTAGLYSCVEYNLETGERGLRHDIVRDLLIHITKAEDALVVNNNAAAVMLVLNALASGGETIISRGELVEVGGGFRIPDVMKCSGSTLKEIGTTNKTHISDYLEAINSNTKAIMRVHTSNFTIKGFTTSVSTNALAKFAHKLNLPLIEDLGSGSFIDFSSYNLPKEPTVQEVVAQDVDIVTFSGDKLLGGPQAGIIVGKKKYIEQIQKNQLMRALRPCKLTLAGLEATLKEYIMPERALKEIPTLSMITMSMDTIKKKTESLKNLLEEVLNSKNVKITFHIDSSQVGGGAFPEAPLPTILVRLSPKNISVNELRKRLLKTNPPLIGRVEHDSFTLDVRTLAEHEFPIIARILNEVLNK